MSDPSNETTKKNTTQAPAETQPNILFITVDQMRYPDFSEGGNGMIEPLKEILGFKDISSDNQYTKHFPGFMRLRKNAVTLENHHIAASACVPSRATLYTGQYGTRTRVVETDSLFKFGSDPNFPWLNPRGIPTTGDWFRAAGYDTHYFGKWDLSYVDTPGPNKGDLNEWGFADWKLSSPDAQGGQLNQLGVFRDGGYADLACDFLRRKGLNANGSEEAEKPWFAAVSLVNPHDIASAYPINWWMPESVEEMRAKLAEEGFEVQAGSAVQTIDKDSPENDPDVPKSVPAQGSESNPLPGGSATIKLNDSGFGVNDTLFSNPESLHDDLRLKPDCQFDYSYKMGLALKSRRPEMFQEWQTLPFQTYKDNGDPQLTDEWFQAYGQFYAYLHSLADREINRVLDTLDATGQADNTIVVFLSDHGEYGGVQGGMIEKWHTSYDQILRVPVVFSGPLVNPQEDELKPVTQLTSHIDILPTILGFTSFDNYEKQNELGEYIGSEKDQTYVPLPGVNLVPTLTDPQTPITFPDACLSDSPNVERNEILFTTDDTITNHLVGEAPTQAYKNFQDLVTRYKDSSQPRLKDGSVVQPNHIRCVKWFIKESDNPLLVGSTWKLSKYWDPEGNEADQWEFYNMDKDTAERNNLVHWQDGLPVLATDRIPTDWGLSADDVQQALNESRDRLTFLEKLYLTPIQPKEEKFV